MKRSRGKSGFTIVELLIVIVIIGILATIVIVAYNGITKKAQDSVLQSDLKNASNTLEVANATDGSYPSSGSSLKHSPDTTLNYSYKTADNTYCIEASSTKTTNVYHVTNGSSITSGGCVNDIPSGPVITNLWEDPKPSYADTLYGVMRWSGVLDAGVLTTNVGATGNGDYMLVKSGPTIYWYRTYPQGSYTLSVKYSKSSGAPNPVLKVSIIDATDGFYGPPGPTWTSSVAGEVVGERLYFDFNLPDPGGGVRYEPGTTFSMMIPNGTQHNAGDWYKVSETMFVSGTNRYRYTDGDSPGWTWSLGHSPTSNMERSTSTGPALE